MLGVILVLTFLISYWILKRSQRNKMSSTLKAAGYKEVPMVKGCYPIVGHGITFGKDIIGFMRKAYAEHGKIFRIKIFKKEMIVVCDRSLVREFFKKPENEMSLYDVLESLFFADAFADDPKFISVLLKIIRKTVSMNYDTFVPKIVEEARRMTQRMRDSATSKKVSVSEESMRFVSRTSAKCFVNVNLSEKFYDSLISFNRILRKVIVLTYFIPYWLLCVTAKPLLRVYRRKMVAFLKPEIDKYRNDPEKTDSLAIRMAVDYCDDDSKKEFTDDEIGNIIVGLLYVASENTALGLSSTLIDLAGDSEFWEKVKAESSKHLASNDIRSLLASPTLEAAIMESARMNSHVFALNRAPRSKNAFVANYYVGDADCVGLCEPMLMVYDAATDIFSNPERYDPGRFLCPKCEPKTPQKVMTWGAGIHLCPGRDFAKTEIRVALAMMTTNFERFDLGTTVPPEKEYFSASAFSERDALVKLSPVDAGPTTVDGSASSSPSALVIQNGDRVATVQHLEEGGWLLRNYLDTHEQISLYNYTADLSKGKEEQQNIASSSPRNPYPLTYYNLVYTGGSNCERPARWLTFAEELWSMLVMNKYAISFAGYPEGEADGSHGFDSVYAQLYGAKSTLNSHKDQYVNWGVSVSIGATAEFQFGEKTILLHSGDVLVADFSKVQHAVAKIFPETAPGWFTGDSNEVLGDMEKKPNNFGRCRCSVQIRKMHGCFPSSLMSIDDFRKLINQ